ncbi:MAG TPA: laccase domain-containing protein, partial [Xanthomonadales bacterium]|nr:laccase domain-containing protein [Xanthomonadales bacterium]
MNDTMKDPKHDWIIPDWPAPAPVSALSTTRNGGVSQGPWQSLNLGTNSGDDPADVARNRQLLNEVLPAPPRWLQQ